MKKVLAPILVLAAFSSYAQQWAEIQIDSNLAVTMPVDYEDKDKPPFERTLTAQVPGGLIQVLVPYKAHTVKTTIENEEELFDSYKKEQTKIVTSHPCEVIEGDTIGINGLKFLFFSCRSQEDEEIYIRHYLFGYIRGGIYAVTFYYLESKESEIAPLRDQLFSSVRLSNTLTMEDQMNHAPYDPLSDWFVITVVIGLFLVFPGLPIFSIVWFVWRGKKVRNVILKRVIYILSLVVTTAWIWTMLYQAQFEHYDDNSGLLIMIFLISVASFAVEIIMIIKKSELWRANMIVSITFLIINSPLTIFLVVMIMRQSLAPA